MLFRCIYHTTIPILYSEGATEAQGLGVAHDNSRAFVEYSMAEFTLIDAVRPHLVSVT